jgi:hypothetical protein
MIKALGLSHGGSGSKGGDRLAKFTHQGRLKPFMDNEILERTDDPLKFQMYNGATAYGYDATLLAKICFAVLDAAKEPNLLQKQQEHLVKQAEILVRGFAIVGINAHFKNRLHIFSVIRVLTRLPYPEQNRFNPNNCGTI